MLSDNAVTILNKRYLEPGEGAAGMFRRVAGGDEDAYQLMSDLDFLPNSPALMNAGTNNGCTFFACFHFVVDDNFFDTGRGIFATREKAAKCAKGGGGVGYYLGQIRPKHSLIRTIHRKACGPVAVLKDYQGVRTLVTQGGKRDLAQMGILPAWHEDIAEFIHVKDEDPEALNSFNISVSWDDDNLREAFADPDSRYGRLWRDQVDSAWKTGDPGVFFRTTVNRTNPTPWLGALEGTNPCGEVPLLNDEPCDLGSLNLGHFVDVKRRQVDWDRLGRAAYVAQRFLDGLHDRTPFPHPDIAVAAGLTRKTGLGVMGWADMLALLGIHYDTEEAVTLALRLAKFIDGHALQSSLDLAAVHGPYPGYNADRAVGPAARNATRTCQAPTGTIALIAGASGGVEPHYALEWERTTYEGIKLQERIPVWDRLDGFVPKIANEIDWRWHVRHQAAWQAHTDLAVSKTINLPNGATRDDISAAYKMMWENGCKGGTVFRDGCRSEQVLVARKTKSTYATQADVPAAVPPPKRRKLPADRDGRTHKFRVGGMKLYLTANTYENGDLGEIFLKVSPQQGSTIDGMLDAFAKTFSLAIQTGSTLADLIRLHKNTRFEPCGLTSDRDIPTCSSIPDYVVRYLERRFANRPDRKDGADNAVGDSGQFCPDCQAPLRYQGGCLVCVQDGCGFSKCG